MDNLIEISKEKIGFFTSIFVYDNNFKIPEHRVYKKQVLECNDYSIYVNYVFLKDLETRELLKFSVEGNSMLLNKKIKSTNKYLIKEMQDFVSANWWCIEKYYSRLIDITDLTKALRIKYSLIPEKHNYICQKRFLNEELYEFYMSLYGVTTIFQKIKASKEIFIMLFCKCLLWYKEQYAFVYWKAILVKNLFSFARVVCEHVKYKGYSYQDLLDSFFILKNSLETIDFYCCMVIEDDVCMDNILVEKLGRPFVDRDGEFDLKLFENKYNDLKNDYYNWFNIYKDCFLRDKIVDDFESRMQLELSSIVGKIINFGDDCEK